MELLETIFARIRSTFAALPEKRRRAARYSMADIGMSAFSLFFMQSESFLSCQRSLGEGRKTSNCRTMFGMAAIPTDNHIRAMLDAVHPLPPAPDHRYRWFEQAPLREGPGGVLVNGVGVTVTDVKGKVTDQNAFVTSLPVARDTVADIVACARARWKIENESFNVLKSNGYHLEHNFGHGQQHLAMMFAALTLPAFAIHTVRDCIERIRPQARTAKRARSRFFEHIRTITAYLVFPDWNTLMQTLIDSKPPPEIETQIAG